jgi:Arc/MetJ-type ribon-helix-helix transcriptional regulator
MIPIQVRLTKKIIEKLDELVENGVYSNRSEAIRDAARRLAMNLSNGTQNLNGNNSNGDDNSKFSKK